MLDLWAIGRYDLGLSDEDFGSLTPALFEALLIRRTAETKQDYLRSGIVAAAVINSSMAAPKEPVHPIEFVPGETKPEEPDLTTLSPEEQQVSVKRTMSKRTETRV